MIKASINCKMNVNKYRVNVTNTARRMTKWIIFFYLVPSFADNRVERENGEGMSNSHRRKGGKQKTRTRVTKYFLSHGQTDQRISHTASGGSSQPFCGWKHSRMGICTDSPCILQDIIPFVSTAMLTYNSKK